MRLGIENVQQEMWIGWRVLAQADFENQIRVGGSSDKFVSSPTLYRRIELVVESVRRSRVIQDISGQKSAIDPGVGNEGVFAGENLGRYRRRRHVFGRL